MSESLTVQRKVTIVSHSIHLLYRWRKQNMNLFATRANCEYYFMVVEAEPLSRYPCNYIISLRFRSNRIVVSWLLSLSTVII